jgi:FtsH-binding integral membrane protein
MENLINYFLISVIICIILLFSAFNNFKLTCNNYILNTYLYLILSFFIVYIYLQLLNFYKINIKTTLAFLGSFILTLILIVSITLLSPQQILLKHSLWLLFLGFIALSFQPLYNRLNKNLIKSTFLATVLIATILSLFAQFFPNLISFSLGPILFIALLSVILVEILNIFFFKKEDSIKNQKWISIFCIFLFSLFILYDTKVLLLHQKTCIIPDYINESLKLFLDMINMFVNLLRLRS